MVDGIVGGHDRRQLLVLDQALVGIQVELAHVAAVHVGTGHVAVELAVVGEVVLRRGDGLQILGVGAHQAADKAAGDLRGEERILAVGLAGAAPAGVADRLHDGRPEGQALRAGGVDGARLVGDGGGHPLGDGRIPAGSDGDTVGKGRRPENAHGGVRAGEHAMQRFAPDIVVLEAEPGHGGHVVAQQALLLFEREAGHQVRRALLEGVGRVQVNRHLAVLGPRRHGAQQGRRSGKNEGANRVHAD